MANTIIRKLGGIAAATALTAVALASPAHAAPREVDYINLGDSYSAAIGTGGLHPAAPLCIQGDGPDHVSKLDSKNGVDLLVNAACSGAETSDITAAVSAIPGELLQDAELITLTLGGNDLSWIPFLTSCLSGDPTNCAIAMGTVQSELATLPPKVYQTLFTIRAYAPNAKIVVLGYPNLLDGNNPANPVPAGLVGFMKQATGVLNGTLAAVSQQIPNTVFVDVASRFDGHGADSTDPWIHSFVGTSESFHPNEKGYNNGYFPALMSAVNLGQLAQ